MNTVCITKGLHLDQAYMIHKAYVSHACRQRRSRGALLTCRTDDEARIKVRVAVTCRLIQGERVASALIAFP